MKKHLLCKQLLIAGAILSLSVACQSKPNRPTPEKSAPLEIEGESEEGDEESLWDQTDAPEPAPVVVKPAEPAQVSAPVVVEPIKPPVPVVETKVAPAVAEPVIVKPAVQETPAPTPAPAAVVEVKKEELKVAPEAVSAPAVVSEKATVSENTSKTETTNP